MLTNNIELVSRFLEDQFGSEIQIIPIAAVGLLDSNNKVVAGLVAYDYTGTNVWCHIAATVPSPTFMIAVLKLLFDDLLVNRVSMLVYDHNEKAVRFMKSMGAKLEHTLKGGHMGGDLLLYVLWKNTGIHQRIEKGINMGMANFVYVVRDYPHPKYPRDTIMFASGIYELPDGTRKRATDDSTVAVVSPPTNRNGFTISRVPSYHP